jgi:hypothetical protein
MVCWLALAAKLDCSKLTGNTATPARSSFFILGSSADISAPDLGAQISSPFLLGIYVHYFDGVAVKIRNTIRGNREHLERIVSGDHGVFSARLPLLRGKVTTRDVVERAYGRKVLLQGRRLTPEDYRHARRAPHRFKDFWRV